MPTRKPSHELRGAMPEETKPVQREAFERWAKKKWKLADDSYHLEETNEVYYAERVNHSWIAWQASADAALERAAQVAENAKTFRVRSQTVAENIAVEIRALKGRE